MAGLLTASDIASITSTVASSLDASLPWYYNANATSRDGYGHTNAPNWVSLGNLACNVTKPSATVLENYANIIGSKRAVTLRVMNSSNVQEGQRVDYDSLSWIVQGISDADSYTVTKEVLITVIS